MHEAEKHGTVHHFSSESGVVCARLPAKPMNSVFVRKPRGRSEQKTRPRRSARKYQKAKKQLVKRAAFSISQSYHRKDLLLCAYAVEPAEKLVQHYDFVRSEHADFLNHRNGLRTFL